MDTMFTDGFGAESYQTLNGKQLETIHVSSRISLNDG